MKQEGAEEQSLATRLGLGAVPGGLGMTSGRATWIPNLVVLLGRSHVPHGGVFVR